MDEGCLAHEKGKERKQTRLNKDGGDEDGGKKITTTLCPKMLSQAI